MTSSYCSLEDAFPRLTSCGPNSGRQNIGSCWATDSNIINSNNNSNKDAKETVQATSITSGSNVPICHQVLEHCVNCETCSKLLSHMLSTKLPKAQQQQHHHHQQVIHGAQVSRRSNSSSRRSSSHVFGSQASSSQQSFLMQPISAKSNITWIMLFAFIAGGALVLFLLQMARKLTK